ncbi:uncharacterized protein JCM15063_003635 [Sporobolomyces koalae]|uniref:uncharacterized protein n=1 Tax=Sporobolomyces koalae TaxID=500713 RepID=UPI003176896A
MSVVVTEPITSGLVVLKTTLGDVLIELWRREAPKAVRNFIQLCLEGHYDGVPFNRIVPGFIAQIGGDDDCIFDEGSFEIETNQRLKFNRRGLVAMASDPQTKSNMSQFFITLDSTPELQNKHTIFGRISGDTLFNVLKLQEVELEPNSERPVYAPIIKSVEVKDDPFEDGPDKIVPRITARERKEQERAKKEMKIERAKQREQGKRKGTKNKALLSFGADAEETPEGDGSALKTKFKSAHDVATDGRLSAQVIDDRGTSATLPADFLRDDDSRAPPAKKRRGEEDDYRRRSEEKRSRPDAPSTSASAKLDEARALKAAKTPKSEAERRKEEIAKVQAELKKMSKSAESDEEAQPKKSKRTGPSLLQLEREKYLNKGSANAAASKVSRGKRKADDDDDVLSALDGFRKKLSQASKPVPKPKEDEGAEGEPKREKLHGIDLNDDELEDDDDIDLWAAASAHSLKFRKDATLDQHNIDEYAVVDPLAKETRTLDELKVRAGNNSLRRYGGDRADSDRRGGRNDRERGGGSGHSRGDRERYDDRRRDDRRDGDRRGGGSGYGAGGGRGDRPEVQGNWKKDRVSTADLA